ncbi:gas vesicle protein K [Streptomyces sp. NPDC051217]|uniref:gas vesicle protein K n=1 Tax=Streptomyces sp. NPDC051217 TaxID=3365644 RepID=UPI0037AFE7AA
MTTTRMDLDREQMGRDLVALVLTVVELLRQLMERQAIRRVEQGDLSEEQIEEIGTTLIGNPGPLRGTGTGLGPALGLGGGLGWGGRGVHLHPPTRHARRCGRGQT